LLLKAFLLGLECSEIDGRLHLNFFEELTALLGRLGKGPLKRNGEKTQNVGDKRKEKREREV